MDIKKEQNIREAFNESQKGLDSLTGSKIKLSKKEKKESYTILLQPSVRKKISDLAKEYEYTSDSEFLNELIKTL
jgi:hypothetical protein